MLSTRVDILNVLEMEIMKNVRKYLLQLLYKLYVIMSTGSFSDLVSGLHARNMVTSRGIKKAWTSLSKDVWHQISKHNSFFSSSISSHIPWQMCSHVQQNNDTFPCLVETEHLLPTLQNDWMVCHVILEALRHLQSLCRGGNITKMLGRLKNVRQVRSKV